MRSIICVFVFLAAAHGKPLSKHAALVGIFILLMNLNIFWKFKDYLQTFGYLQPDRLTADGSSEEEIDVEVKHETAVRYSSDFEGFTI